MQVAVDMSCTRWAKRGPLLLCLVCLFSCAFSMNVDENARNIFEALSKTLNCGKFKTLIIEAGPNAQEFYTSNIKLTVFAPNDTAFMHLRREQYNKIFDMSPMEKERYVKSYTTNDILETSDMSENLIVNGLGPNSNKLFFHRQQPVFNSIPAGNAGRTQYYMNGAQIIQADVRAGNGIIQVIDRVLEPPISRTALGFIRQPDPKVPTQQLKFFTELLHYVSGEYHRKTIQPMQSEGRITVFVPTDRAIEEIPSQYLNKLRSEPAELARIIQQHMIPEKAVYTSFVYHNHGYRTAEERIRVIFKKNIRELVYVAAGGVTALIVHGNTTVMNGVVHMIDNVLGFVYLTAWEQIVRSSDTSDFERLTNRGRKDLQDFLVRPNGVTVFVPTNEAFAKLRNLPNVDINNNLALINQVFELHLLEAGTVFTLTSVNGGYESRQAPVSQYRRWRIKVYSEGNETWAEGGYVKARVIRPDVGVTNGYVHLVDGIFGVPSRDVPGIIYCEDWLIKTYYIMSTVGLPEFLSDVDIKHQLPACTSNDPRRSTNLQQTRTSNSFPGNDNSGGTFSAKDLIRGGCGDIGVRCDFTIFVPNGTTTDYFQQTMNGQKLFEDRNRLRYVFRRMIVRNEKIYIDQLSRGQKYFISDTGDEIRLNVINDRYQELIFRNVRARIIHSDLGATNGVIHIVDSFLFVPEDLTREVTSSVSRSVPSAVGFLTVVLVFLYHFNKCV